MVQKRETERHPDLIYQQIPLCQRGQLLRATTLQGGLATGYILYYVRVNNPYTCRKRCCATSRCNVALVVENTCYIMRVSMLNLFGIFCRHIFYILRFIFLFNY